MPHKTIDFSRRADVTKLTELMDEPCSRDEMRACLVDLARVNRWFWGYRPTLDWLQSMRLERVARPIRIADVGCGYGDTLRRVERWAQEKGISKFLLEHQRGERRQKQEQGRAAG